MANKVLTSHLILCYIHNKIFCNAHEPEVHRILEKCSAFYQTRNFFFFLLYKFLQIFARPVEFLQSGTQT